MSDHAAPGNGSLSAAQRVDAACYRFEKAWREGRRPRIEDFLNELPPAERLALLHELIPLDINYRRLAGEDPQPEEYHARFPEVGGQSVADVATGPLSPPALPLPVPRKPVPTDPAAASTQRFRCPHCHNPVQLADGQGDEVLCPGCGSSFKVRDARQTTTTQPMRQLGKFQLLERVGLGAFGAVWKARDTELDRVVALKIPHAGLLTTGDELERFRREARAAAQLRHPGVVTIHEVVELEGLPTIVSDFIDGVPLRSLLESRRLTFAEAAALLAEVAEAVDYAHHMGLVHRDLKPANIMIEYRRPQLGDLGAAADPTEGQAGSGRPLVMDFGLALRGEAEVTMTQDGHILGTPAYMSPEQAAGYSHQADARSDVYSLGVIFYELLTGELPFRGSKAMLLHQVLHEEPRPPRKVNDKIPRDLETICLKAMAKAPAKRYPGARGLADDLRRWQNGEPIQARPVGRLVRTIRWLRRNPVVSAIVTTVCVIWCAWAILFSLMFATVIFASLLFGFTGKDIMTSRAGWGEAEVISAKAELKTANQALEKRCHDLERTLARSLLRPVGFETGALRDPEIDALWELAGHRRENVWRLFVTEAVEGPGTTHQLRNRAEAALHAAVGLEPTERDEVESELMTRLRDARVADTQRLELAVVAALLGNLSAKNSREVIRTIGRAIEKTKDAGRKEDLGTALAAVAIRLEPKEAADTLAEAMAKTRNPYVLGPLAEGLAAVAVGLEITEAAQRCAAAADSLAQALAQATDPSDFDRSASRLTAALTVVAARVESKEAAQRCTAAADSLAQATAKISHRDASEGSAEDVAAVTTRLEAKEAAAILVEAMAKARMSTDLKRLTAGLNAVLVGSHPLRLSRNRAALAAAVGNLGGGGHPAGIWLSLGLALQPPPCRLSTQELVELLKQPLCIGEARRAILDHLGNRYGRRFRDHWEFVHFAHEHLPDLDLTSPPRRYARGAHRNGR